MGHDGPDTARLIEQVRSGKFLPKNWSGPSERAAEKVTVAESGPRKAFSMSRDDALFWIGIALFGDGVYLMAEHPYYGIPLIISGVALLAWSNRGHMPKPPIRLAVLILAMTVTVSIVAFDYYDRHFGNRAPSATVPAVQGSGFAEATQPKKPRSKETIRELLTESAKLLEVVQSGVSLANEWHDSLITQNPERICLDINSRSLQDKITALANKLDAAYREIANIYDQNRIDQAEFNTAFGSSVANAGFAPAAQSLRQYAHGINLLGERPSCETLIRTGNVPIMFVNMVRSLDQFSIWIGQSQENLSRYQDSLRKELRNSS